MSYSKEEILRLAEENNVEFISLQFTDIFGTLKNVTIPVSMSNLLQGNGYMLLAKMGDVSKDG